MTLYQYMEELHQLHRAADQFSQAAMEFATRTKSFGADRGFFANIRNIAGRAENQRIEISQIIDGLSLVEFRAHNDRKEDNDE